MPERNVFVSIFTKYFLDTIINIKLEKIIIESLFIAPSPHSIL